MGTTLDAVAAAFDKLEAGGAGAKAEEEGESASPEAAPAVAGPPADAPLAEGEGKATEGAEETSGDAAGAETRARDGKGRFAKGGKPKAEAKPVEKPVETAPEARPEEVQPEQAAQPQEQPKPQTPELKPPQSWRPAAREKWASLPPEVQAEAVRREKEVQTALQEAAPAKKLAADFQQAIAPFEAMIRAEQTAAGEQYSPLRTVQNLLHTAAALRTAPPAAKAQLLTGIVKGYGVPPADLVVGLVKAGAVTVEQLDAALAGEAPPQGQPSQPPLDANALAQQVRQQLLQELQAQRQQHAQTEAQREIQTWAEGKEFYEDVRHLMRGLLLAATEEGRAMSLDEAYDIACRTDKDVSAILSQRDAAKAANASQASTQRARAAASTVRTQPASIQQPARPKDTYSAVEAAWAQLEAGGRR